MPTNTPPAAPPNPVTYPSAPTPPNFGDLYNQGIQIGLQNAPAIAQNNAAQIYGTGAYAGAGTADLTKYMDSVAADSANRNAGTTLATEQQYAPGYNQLAIDALKQADPQGYALRQNLGSQLNSDLGLGSQLDDRTTQEIQNQVRGSETARGNISGLSPAIEEGLTLGQAGQALKQQREQNAQGYLNGGQITGAVSGTAAPIAPNVTTPTNTFSPAAATAGVNYGLGTYGDLTSQYGAGVNAYDSGLQQQNSMYSTGANYESPWMALLGTAIGGAGRAGAAYATGGMSTLAPNTMTIPRATAV